MKILLLLAAALSLFACKSKNAVPPYDISLVIPGVEPMCAYQLPEKYRLLFNPHTKEYVIGNSDSVIVAWIGDGDNIKEPSYLGYSIGRWYGEPGYKADNNTRLAWVYRFKDSCCAKGALYRYLELQKQKEFQDSSANEQRHIADSLKNDFKTIHQELRIGYSNGDTVDTLFINGKQVLVLFSGTQEGDGETYVHLSKIKNPALGRSVSNELPCFYYMKSDSTYNKIYSLKYCDYSDGTARWFDVQKNYEPTTMQEPVLVVTNVTIKEK